MLSYMVVRFETFDSDAFLESFKKFDANGVIVTWNYGGDIKVVHSPPSIPLKKHYRYYRQGTISANRWLKWNLLFIQIIRIMVTVLLRHRVQTFFIGGGDVILWIAQLFKKMGRIKKTMTAMEDWSVPRPSPGIAFHVNRAKMLLNDWLIVRMDTTVIIYPKEIYDLRNAY